MRAMRLGRSSRTTSCAPSPAKSAKSRGGAAVLVALLLLSAVSATSAPKRRRARPARATRELIAAVRARNEEAVGAALDAGADVDAYISIDGDRGNDQTGLMYSSLLGLVGVAKVLLSRGADMSLGTRDSGFTPLHGAAFQGQPQMIRLLLEHGADPLDRHADGFIPFHRACWGNSARHTEAALRLLQACPSCIAVRRPFHVRFCTLGAHVLLRFQITARDPENQPAFRQQGGMMTALDMALLNPMTTALIRQWEETGTPPPGAVAQWGSDLFVSQEQGPPNGSSSDSGDSGEDPATPGPPATPGGDEDLQELLQDMRWTIDNAMDKLTSVII